LYDFLFALRRERHLPSACTLLAWVMRYAPGL